MKACIITGGYINDKFVLERLEKESYDLLIAVDHGADFFADKDIKPQFVVGDMDSAQRVSKEIISSWEGCTLCKYPAEKDETDTEPAIHLAIEKHAQEIHIYGATGSRIDHVLGNIQILKIALDAGVVCAMFDECNKIRLIQGTVKIKKDEQFGNYVSLLPWFGEVQGVCLRGMKYPLEDYHLTYGRALGVSNEIVAETATIVIGSGIAVMIESRDEFQ